MGDGAYFSPDYPDCMFIVGDEYDLWDRQEVFQGVRLNLVRFSVGINSSLLYCIAQTIPVRFSLRTMHLERN